MAFSADRFLGIAAVVGIVVGAVIGTERAGVPGALLGAFLGPLLVVLIIQGPPIVWGFLTKHWWVAIVALLLAGGLLILAW